MGSAVAATKSSTPGSTSIPESDLHRACAQLLEEALSEDSESQQPTVFHATSVPPISVRDYMERIATYSHASAHSMVLGLIYVDHLVKEPQNNLSFHPRTIHRLLL